MVARARVPAVGLAVAQAVGPVVVAVDREVADRVTAQVVLAVGRAVSPLLWAPGHLEVLLLVQEVS